MKHPFTSSALCSLSTLLLTGLVARADVTVSTLFSDHMVIQRDLAAPVWGQATAGEEVTVTLGAASSKATADAQGKWSLKLPAQAANAKPQELTIKGKNTVTIKDVLVGDVWICSGQSNMEWNLGILDDEVGKVGLLGHRADRHQFIGREPHEPRS